MGRTKSYVEADVLDAAAHSFAQNGYEGTSLDDLVKATGLHRGSIYSAFGSKNGLFVASYRYAIEAKIPTAQGLTLVALMELSAKDKKVHKLANSFIQDHFTHDAAAQLGKALLYRGKIKENHEQ